MNRLVADLLALLNAVAAALLLAGTAAACVYIWGHVDDVAAELAPNMNVDPAVIVRQRGTMVAAVAVGGVLTTALFCGIIAVLVDIMHTNRAMLAELRRRP